MEMYTRNSLEHSDSEKCYVCGKVAPFAAKGEDSVREATCLSCGACTRNGDVARAIIQTFVGHTPLSLEEALPYLKDLTIYEAQASGPIHNRLKSLPHYIASEYLDGVPLGSQNKSGVRCEDLQQLSFSDNTLDLVITQDVLEHIREPEKAFSEIWRVLKPGGCHIFTIPYHAGKKTIKRIEVVNGEDMRSLPPVYHGDPLRGEGALVYTDFGDDIVNMLHSVGLPTQIISYTKWYRTEKIPAAKDKEGFQVYLSFYNGNELSKFLKYNSIVFRSEKVLKNGDVAVPERNNEERLPDNRIAGLRDHLQQTVNKSQRSKDESGEKREFTIYKQVAGLYSGFMKQVLPYGTSRRNNYDLVHRQPSNVG